MHDSRRGSGTEGGAQPKARPGADPAGCVAPSGAEPQYVFVIDPGGVVLLANEALAADLGTTIGALAGRRIYDFFPSEAAKRRRAMAEQVLRDKTSLRYEDASRSGRVLDTSIHPLLDGRGRVGGLAVSVTDVTRHKRNEEELFRLASAVEQAGEAFVIVDETHSIRYVNQAFEEMTGYSASEAKGRPVEMLYHGLGKGRGFERIAKTLAKSEVWTGRVENRRKDGAPFQCEMTVSAIRGKGGVIKGYAGIWRDATQVESLERQLRQAQKVEALAALAGGIAHDFNNILGPIILHSQLGVSRHPDGDPSRAAFEQILDAAERAQALVGQILQLGRKTDLDEAIPFRLGHIVKECVKLLRPTLPADIRILTDLRADNDYLVADPAQLHQVVMNLCTNAAQAMRERGGTLTIGLCRRRGARRAGQAKDMVELAVADTGHGIAPEIMDKIFDPFFTTKRGSLGTGLGLAVAHNIVSRLSGTIQVDSAPGKGARFTVLLPGLDNPAAAIGRHCACLERGENECILFVDDDPRVTDSAKLTLECLGYKVVARPGGPQALQLFQADPEGFDLAMVNVTMPEMSGTELTRELLARRPGLPVILFSGGREIVSPEQARRLGAREFLPEPFHLEQLAQTVRRALRQGPG